MKKLIRCALMGLIALVFAGVMGGGGATRLSHAAEPSAASAVLGAPVNVALTNLDNKQGLIIAKSVIYGDRKEYWADDETGQFLIALSPAAAAAKAEGAAKGPESKTAGNKGPEKKSAESKGAENQKAGASEDAPEEEEAPSAAAAPVVEVGAQSEQEGFGMAALPGLNKDAPAIAERMVAVLESAGGVEVQRVTLGKPVSPKFHLSLKPMGLVVGSYKLKAWLEDASGAKTAEAEWAFIRSGKKGDAMAFPGDGLPVTLEAIADGRETAVPMVLAIPMSRGMVKDVSELGLTRDGKDVGCQIVCQATWGPGGSVRWAQAKFTAQYKDGKAEGYRLVRKGAGAARPAGRVKVTDSAEQVRVDNGYLAFTVSKKSFKGIEKAWFDAAGQGKYDVALPVISAKGEESGPYFMDERLVRFSSAADKSPKVWVEETGPESVTVTATGWYADGLNRVGPMCQYVVRMTLAAGQPEVRIAHHTVITYDTRLHKIRDLGFVVNHTGADRYAFGVDGAGIMGKLAQTAATPGKRRGEQPAYASVYMHQKTWEQCTVTGEDKKTTEGKKSDGWAAAWKTGAPAVSVALRDIWEKFPKELEARNDALVVHGWPKNGKRVFKLEDELALKNIYKFWCFHQHPMLDLELPQDYYEVLAGLAGTETRETRAEHALNGNGQGMTLTNNMAVRVYPAALSDEKGAKLAEACLGDARILEARPYAALSPMWQARSQALEAIWETNGDFQRMEDAVMNGLISYNGSVERGQEYGMLIWPDTHTYWLPAEGRASLHRTWQNSHYHQVGNAWVLWLRSGDARMLRWARDNSAHFRDVGTIAYAEPGSRATAISFHLPGAMHHCKGCTPWGSEVPGMIRRDTHAGLYGHWIDPDAHLYAWLMDGDERGRDLYNLWVNSLKVYGFVGGGVRREVNNTLAMVINAYEYTGDADFLPAIWNMGLTLRTKEPLEKQNPGPMWHPLWINRYYHMTRDPEYVAFIKHYGTRPGMGNTWNLALSALAYEVSGDKTYLTQQLGSVQQFPRRMYRSAGDPYDYYGLGPGPLGMNWGEMGIGSYMRALKQAGISSFPADMPEPFGQYPALFLKKSYQSQLWALSNAGGEVELATAVSGVEGDANRGEFVVGDAQGKVLAKKATLQAHRVSVSEKLKLEAGQLVSLSFNGYGGLSTSVKGVDAQAGILLSNRGYSGSRQYFHMSPAGEAKPASIRFVTASTIASERSVVSVIVRDATGKVVSEVSMHPMFRVKETTVTLDPAKNPLPWVVDSIGAVRMSVDSETPKWVIAPTKRDLEVMKPRLKAVVEMAEEK
jgi:hypothetical protein